MHRIVERAGKRFLGTKVSGVETDVFTMSVLADVMAENGLKKLFRYPFYAMTISTTHRADEWIDEVSYRSVVDKILAHVRKQGSGTFRDLKRRSAKVANDLDRYVRSVVPKIPAMGDAALVRTYAAFMRRYLSAYGTGVITFLYEADISERLRAELPDGVPAAEALSQVLRTSYESFMIKDERMLLGVRRASSKQERQRLAARYLRKYYYSGTGYRYHPSLTVDEVIVRSKKVHEPKAPRRHRQVSVALTPVARACVSILRETEGVRDQRKRSNLIGTYCMYRFLEAVCSRTGTAMDITDRICWFEIPALLASPKATRKAVASRESMSVIFDGKKPRWILGTAVSPILASRSSAQLSGTPASKGIAKGPARIVFGQSDFHKVQPGDVLVAEMTRPDFLPIMRRAAAIVTDEGGLTCHAAIVARELGVPCIVGVRSATRDLADGDMVTVDANKGTVEKN